MISVKITPKGIHVTGHGQTRVCAAVSALVQHTALGIGVLTDDNVTAVLEKGDEKIEYGDYERLSVKSKTLIDALYMSLKQMSDDYPDDLMVAESEH